jgi:multiple sugar transport system permease protein
MSLRKGTPGGRRRLHGAARDIPVYLLLLFLTAAILAPFLWLLTSSLRPVSELYVYPPRWIPETISAAAYGKALNTFTVPLANSAIYGLVTALLTLLVACPAAYSIARFRYPGKKIVTGVLLVSQMLPFVLLLLPLYIIYIQLKIYNTRLGLIVGFTALTIPYATLLLRSFFASLPVDLEDQAMIDGCTQMGALWHVVLPLSTPVLVAVVLSSVVLVWNDVLFTIFLSKDLEVQTASVALYRLFTLRSASGGVSQKEVMLAGGVLLTLPVIFLFTFLQKYISTGITAGALKG